MDTDKLIELSFQCYHTGNFERAQHICLDILQEQPDNEPIIYLLGITYVQLEEYDLAKQYIQKALQFNSNNADAYLALGAIHQKQGHFDKAASCYRKVIEIHPECAEVYENLGDLCREIQYFDEAIDYYKKALHLNPNTPEIWCSLGDIYKARKQLDLATYHYRSALRHRNDYAEVYNKLGNVYHEQRRLDEAINCYQKALKIDLNYSDAAINLNNASHEKKQLDQAANYYQQSSQFAITLGYLKIEMMVNALIHQYYMKTLNVQFHPDLKYDDNLHGGLKRRILENLFKENNNMGHADKFFNDLDRLSAIRKYFENYRLMRGQNASGTETDSRKNVDIRTFERLRHEFLGIVERLEKQLAVMLHS